MKQKIELLAPGGDLDSIKAAIAAGADAVYCGLDRFNARTRATNISFDDLPGILRLAHQHQCQVFLTLNILVLENEISALIALLNKLVNTGIDGVIVQDLGLIYLLSSHFKSLPIHASTQLTTHNEGQIRFLRKMNASRVNLSREMNLQEIKALTEVAHQNQVLTEVFIHGSSCLSFSGICYMSSVQGANSGNRGRCSQPCRDPYLTTQAGKDFPLNLKDHSGWYELNELAGAGVNSFKIEGRIKNFQYVYSVTNAWKKQLRRFDQQDDLQDNDRELFQVFNRDFTNAHLSGDLSKSMFIDNPRDHSAIHRARLLGGSTAENIEKAKQELHEEKAILTNNIQNQIDRFSVAKTPVTILISGKCGSPLKVVLNTPDSSVEVFSEQNLSDSGTETLNTAMIMKRLKAINDTEYYVDQLVLDELTPGLYLPFKELTSIKKQLLFLLNSSRLFIDPISVPVLKKQTVLTGKTKLLVLISDAADMRISDQTSADICFQLPNSIKKNIEELTSLFLKNRNLIPWFPSILIGEDYFAAIDFLKEVNPGQIVTNNTGIAYVAYQQGISWIAGPYLNTVNSYSLICLKENFNCSGAFISNEISKTQLQQLKCPAGFKLYYSIYHPVVLMTSRQCLFHQVTGCEKDNMDETCINDCAKSASITNLKGVKFQVEKTPGNFNVIYNSVNLLNTDIVTDLLNLFSGYLIDLRDVKTETRIVPDKPDLVKLFKNHLNGHPCSKVELHRQIYPTINGQYISGI